MFIDTEELTYMT